MKKVTKTLYFLLISQQPTPPSDIDRSVGQYYAPSNDQLAAVAVMSLSFVLKVSPIRGQCVGHVTRPSPVDVWIVWSSLLRCGARPHTSPASLQPLQPNCSPAAETAVLPRTAALLLRAAQRCQRFGRAVSRPGGCRAAGNTPLLRTKSHLTVL